MKRSTRLPGSAIASVSSCAVNHSAVSRMRSVVALIEVRVPSGSMLCSVVASAKRDGR